MERIMTYLTGDSSSELVYFRSKGMEAPFLLLYLFCYFHFTSRWAHG
jgi:hypothetical protein